MSLFLTDDHIIISTRKQQKKNHQICVFLCLLVQQKYCSENIWSVKLNKIKIIWFD